MLVSTHKNENHKWTENWSNDVISGMSVYEDIASKSRRQDSPIRDIKVDEQTEDEEEEDLLIQVEQTFRPSRVQLY